MSLIPANSETFEQEVLKSDIPVLVDFYATWCGPCTLTMGHLSAMLSERNGDIKIVKIDVDESRELAQRYNVKGIPTLILFQNGVPADARLNGFSDKRRLHNYVDDVFNGQV